MTNKLGLETGDVVRAVRKPNVLGVYSEIINGTVVSTAADSVVLQLNDNRRISIAVDYYDIEVVPKRPSVPIFENSGKVAVEHPPHYGGGDNPYEAIKVIEAWDLGFNLGNTVKYISRAGKKDPNKTIEDLEKAAWYLNREIQNQRLTQAPEKEKQDISPEAVTEWSVPISEVSEEPSYDMVVECISRIREHLDQAAQGNATIEAIIVDCFKDKVPRRSFTS